jgi:plastocyanin
MDKTLFYALGIALVVSAVVVSLIGLRFEKFPSSRTMLLAVLAYFVALVAATATFAVRNANDEQTDQAKHDEGNAAAASKIANAESTSPAPAPTSSGSSSGSSSSSSSAPTGGGSAIKISADPTGLLKFEQTTVTAKAGADTIDFTNDSPVGHNVQIADSSGKALGGTKTITGGSATAKVDLKPGKYTFFCSVPGHEAAGMKGTLVVK